MLIGCLAIHELCIAIEGTFDASCLCLYILPFNGSSLGTAGGTVVTFTHWRLGEVANINGIYSDESFILAGVYTENCLANVNHSQHMVLIYWADLSIMF